MSAHGESEFVTPKEAAYMLGVSTATLSVWKRKGYIKAAIQKNQRVLLYRRSEIESVPTIIVRGFYLPHRNIRYQRKAI